MAADFSVRLYQPTAATKRAEAALDSADGFAAQKAVMKDFQTRYPDDMAVQLRVASFLAMDNLDSTRDFYAARADKEPDNVVPQYVAGRLMVSPVDQRRYAERMLKTDPNSYWGNVLLSGTYNPENDPGLKQAEGALRKSIATDNSLPFAVERLGHLLKGRGETAAADEVYVKLGEMEPDRFEPVQYRIMLIAGDHQKAIKLIDDFLAKNPANVDALYAKARGQRELSDWSGHIATMRRVLDISPTGDHAYDLACGYSLAGQKDSAFVWLFKAADLGFADMEQYKSDEDLVPLRDEPRWTELLGKVQAAEQAKLVNYMRQAAATAPKRKQEATKERLNLDAPDFTLNDLDGKSVTLSSLKGKVVILDFWATWCGPCRKTMPILDKFYTTDKPKDVIVYGVNVWERQGTGGVKPFLTASNIHFPVLFGQNETAEAYGVRGIPTLVVIDKSGKIAYKHIGYDPSLGEMLTWQTKELLK